MYKVEAWVPQVQLELLINSLQSQLVLLLRQLPLRPVVFGLRHDLLVYLLLRLHSIIILRALVFNLPLAGTMIVAVHVACVAVVVLCPDKAAAEVEFLRYRPLFLSFLLVVHVIILGAEPFAVAAAVIIVTVIVVK